MLGGIIVTEDMEIRRYEDKEKRNKVGVTKYEIKKKLMAV